MMFRQQEPTPQTHQVFRNFSNSHHQNLSTSGKAACACTSAVINTFLMTPLEVLKTRLQVERQATNSKFIFQSILQKEGFRGFFRGLPYALSMSVPSTMIYFSSYDFLKEKLPLEKDSMLLPATAGCIARSAAAALTCPLEYMKTYVQANAAEKMKISKFSQCFTGLGITVMRDGPYAALYWFSFEYLKRIPFFKTLSSNEKSYASRFISDLSCGLFSGMLASAVTNPLDVLKTRIQSTYGDNTKTIRATAMEMIKAEGYQAFTRGIVPRVVRVAPNTAVAVSIYEMIKHVVLSSQQYDNADSAATINSSSASSITSAAALSEEDEIIGEQLTKD